jgi:regulator of replication initiation timing
MTTSRALVPAQISSQPADLVALCRELLALHRQNTEFVLECARLRTEVTLLNRDLADARSQLEKEKHQAAKSAATIQKREQEKADLAKQLAPFREERAKWFHPIAVAMRDPISTASPDALDFRQCLSAWNRVLELTARGWFRSDAIPLTCRDRWELRGSFQFFEHAGMVHYIGLECYADAEGSPEKQITEQRANRVSGTEAVLAEDCKVGDRVLKLKNASSYTWSSNIKLNSDGSSYQCVAFGPDRVPNFDLSPDITKHAHDYNGCKVELASGMDRAWKAGTPVRMHTGIGAGTFCHSDVIGNQWQEIGMTHETLPLKTGTRSVKVAVGCCWTQKDTGSSPPRTVLSGNSLRIRHLRLAFGEFAENSHSRLPRPGSPTVFWGGLA